MGIVDGGPMLDPGGVSQTEQPRDNALGAQLEKQAHEAAERATFHRIEAERWERVGRASMAGLHELNAVVPVAQVTVDALAGDDQPEPASPRY